ncbi:MAG TPA: GDSL-type esterase/lipase family protein [Acidimicrobiia bacterium]|nr:GDSL-type esterase/lipase family protein [Acidimicrobiia bacterium]
MRRTRWTVPFSVAVVIVLGVTAGAVWAAGVWPSGSAHPTARVRRVPTSRPLVSAPASSCRSPLTPDAPLRLWIGGDSLAGSLGPALGTLAGDTGVVQPVFDSRVSSGLTTPGFFDWPEHATQEMARLDPEVAVFIIDANDSELVTGSATAADAKARYAELVTQMLDILAGPGSHRYVYWVGGPTIRDSTTDSGVRQLNDVARSVVVRRPNTTYVDAYRLFGDSQGRFSFTLPDASGTPVLDRSDDGVHFTPAGADRLAQPIFQALDSQCRVQSQAVPGSPKAVIETPGSTQVGSGQGTAPSTRPPPTSPPTSPPAPAPPTTRAPVVTLPRSGTTRT